METTQENTNESKVQFGLRMDPDVYKAVSSLAVKEDRTLANMINRLLKESPQVQEILESDAVGVAA